MAKGQIVDMFGDVTKMTPADMVRLAAKIASLTDPTGASDVVASYSYPKCSDMIDNAKSLCRDQCVKNCKLRCEGMQCDCTRCNSC